MKLFKKIIKIVLFVILALIFVASLLVIVANISQKKNGYTGMFGYTFDVVLTDSMSGEDGFEIGDIVIGKVIDADTVIEVGDIISFHTVVNGQEITKTHRVSDMWEEGSFGTVYETWGDNRTSCPTADSGFRLREDIISVYTGKIEGVGKILTALKTPAGYLALAIPIGLYILYEIFVLISIFMNNKKKQMLEEAEDAKEAIIREYLAAQQKAASAEVKPDDVQPEEKSPDDSSPDGEAKE